MFVYKETSVLEMRCRRILLGHLTLRYMCNLRARRGKNVGLVSRINNATWWYYKLMGTHRDRLLERTEYLPKKIMLRLVRGLTPLFLFIIAYSLLCIELDFIPSCGCNSVAFCRKSGCWKPLSPISIEWVCFPTGKNNAHPKERSVDMVHS